MKRGFLNTSKGKKVLSQTPTATPKPSSAPVGFRPPGGASVVSETSSELSRKKAHFKKIPEIYHDPMPLIVVKVPESENSAPPGGYTVWLVYEPTVKKVLGASPSVAPLPKPTHSEQEPAFVIKPSPNKGLGVFATRDIEIGEILFSERPLLLAPVTNVGMASAFYSQALKLDRASQTKLGVDEWEKHLRQALDAMLPEDRAEFMKLANSQKGDECGPLMGIIRTNGFAVDDEIHDGDKLLPSQFNSYTAVTKIGSRVNHSCTPNIFQEFSTSSFSFQFEALSNIKAGEELFLTYIPLGAAVTERRAMLAKYGFVCHCTACDNATPESDKLRREYEHLEEQYMANINWSGRGSVEEREIQPVLELRDALKKEGLMVTKAYKSTIVMLAVFYKAIGMPEKSKPFLEELRKYPDILKELPGIYHESSAPNPCQHPNEEERFVLASGAITPIREMSRKSRGAPERVTIELQVGAVVVPGADGQTTNRQPNTILYGNVPGVHQDYVPLTAVTIPPPGTCDPIDGTTVWLGKQPTMEKTLGRSPQFRPIPKPQYYTPAFTIRPTYDKGLGVFATRDMKLHDLIFSERPLLVAPTSSLAALSPALRALLANRDAESQLELIMADLEMHFGRAVDMMLPENREEYLKLPNSHQNDGSGPLLGIRRTNGFGLDIYDGDGVLQNRVNGYSAVTKIGSRINHSCIPNVYHDFSISSFSMQFRALADIKAGDELVYSYISPSGSVAERHAALAPYGFICHCPACDHATPESDALRKSYEGLVHRYQDTIDWRGITRPRESVIDPVLKLHEALLNEGLAFTNEYKRTTYMLMSFYEGIGMYGKAEPYRLEVETYPPPGKE
ncbi:LOW QUALITY PROTEIN: hypothetical protein CVT26_013111 [Gymnopilus dilepis]|uniref:SET domain-containing protein n=1 Tax=Gymnopilus dilepis TaxID=231916 RepID=A0A409YF72_9AGAR|nr:LOW QUALITY PROTEIN: hypothetical protein CVT26_013111 [Gymnopilus dilepis]